VIIVRKSLKNKAVFVICAYYMHIEVRLIEILQVEEKIRKFRIY
jgi:hypothetical protein